jgi:hypothetical protein
MKFIVGSFPQPTDGLLATLLQPGRILTFLSGFFGCYFDIAQLLKSYQKTSLITFVSLSIYPEIGLGM